MSSTAQLFREMLDSLPPAPRFDRVVVHAAVASTETPMSNQRSGTAQLFRRAS